MFPRWLPGLAGRRVPIRLAVGPGPLVAVMVATAAKDMPKSLGDGDALVAITEWPLVTPPTFLWPLWTFALAMARSCYGIRRTLTEAKAAVGHNTAKTGWLLNAGPQSPKFRQSRQFRFSRQGTRTR